MESNEKLQALLEGIRREAGEERERVLAEARDTARRILEEADARAADLAREARRRAELALRQEQERERSVARLSVSAARLRGARAALASAFDLASRRIRERCDSAQYPAAIATLIRQALEAVPGPVTLNVDARDAGAARQALVQSGREGEVVAEDGDPGIAVATSADGMRRADNSLSVRLSAAAGTLENEVLRILTGERPGG